MSTGGVQVPIVGKRHTSHDGPEDEGDGDHNGQGHHSVDEFPEPRVREYPEVEEENRHSDGQHGRIVDDAFCEDKLRESESESEPESESIDAVLRQRSIRVLDYLEYGGELFGPDVPYVISKAILGSCRNG